MCGNGVPPLWFRLPPGFHDVGPEDRAALDTIAQAMDSPAAQRDLAHLMDGFDRLHGLDVVHTAIGLHPEEPVGVCTSLFSLTARLADDPNPRVAVAKAALGIARSTVWNASAQRCIDLPSSQPCYLVAGTVAPPHAEWEVFQARITTSHPGGSHLLVLDLTSASAEHHEAYADILEAVAHTLLFTDPHPAPPRIPITSRILDVLQ